MRVWERDYYEHAVAEPEIIYILSLAKQKVYFTPLVMLLYIVDIFTDLYKKIEHFLKKLAPGRYFQTLLGQD